jgi:hypothetical protein
MNKNTIITTLARPTHRKDNLISLMASCYVIDNLESDNYLLHKYHGNSSFTLIIIEGEGDENDEPKVIKHTDTYTTVELSFASFFNPKCLKNFISKKEGVDYYTNIIYIFKNVS